MKFDCIEGPLCKLFYGYGGVVAKFPLVFLTLSILITCLLSGGLPYLEYDQDTLNLLAPEDGRWKEEKEIALSIFDHQNDKSMLPNRMLGSTRFGGVIITPVDSSRSLLEEDAMREVIRFHDIVSNITITGDHGQDYSFEDLCMLWQGRCIENTILTFYNYDAEQVSERKMTYPFAFLANGFRFFNGGSIGGIEPPDIPGHIQEVEKAAAMRLFYFLRNDESADDRHSASWEDEYARIVNQFRSNAIKISWTTSQELLHEVDNVVNEVFGLWWVGIVLVVFCVGAASTNNWVQSQPMLCLMGMLAAGMAILSAYGLMGFLKVPYNILSGSVPFLILGISLDDTFIVIGSWRQTSSSKSLERRIQEALSESALSITITSLTDAVAFSIGIYADFRAVQAFSKACVAAIVLCYLFQLLFFFPCVVFSGKRQMQNRHCWTFRKVIPKPKSESIPYRIFCAGDGGTSENVTGTPAMKFFRDHYAPFLNKSYVAIVVVIGYAAYLGTAMWGYTLLEEGFQERNWVLDDSHLVGYFDLGDQYFSHFGPEINVIATDEVDYSDPKVQQSLEDTLNELEASQYTMESSAFTTTWLRSYLDYLDNTQRNNITKTVFMDILCKEFLNHPFYQQYSLDIVFNDRNDSIIASRFLVYTKDMNNKKREADMMLEFRDIVAKSDVDLIVYHANFIMYDQYIMMWPHTLHNLLIAGGAMFIIALFLIPHPVCALIVTASIASIIIGVLGYMSIWGIPLNHVSMVNLILCVGFSVDFSAHICYSFISAPAKNKPDRVRYALFYLGLPILQGGLSTILACVGTSTTAASSYRIFFKTMFLVITLGMLHGLVFLPVFLKIFIPNCTKPTEEDEKEKEKEKEAQKEKSTTEKFIATAAIDSEGKNPYIVTKTMEGSVYQNGAQLITGQITWTDSKGEQTESKKWTVLQKGVPDDVTKPSSMPLLSENGGNDTKQAPTMCIQPLYDDLSPDGKSGERGLSEYEKQLVQLPSDCLSKNLEMLKDKDAIMDKQAMSPLLYGGVPSGDLHHMSVSVKYVYNGHPKENGEVGKTKQCSEEPQTVKDEETIDISKDNGDQTSQCNQDDDTESDDGTNVDQPVQKQYKNVTLDLALDPNRETRL